jgi:nicotinate-nucleotide adenylyltransferase
MIAAPRVGVLGGTLDPIHLGHLEAAGAARGALNLDRVIVVPARVPPHRGDAPKASAFHRFAMAALCAADYDWMAVSDDELLAPGPSFTAETLDRVRASGLQASQIVFITGADAFAEIETWHRYPEVLDLAHFAVVSRPGLALSAITERLPSLKSRVRSSRTGTAVASPAVFLVEAATPDISSTEVRRRLAAGEPITGLVPPPVERHISRHHLYREMRTLDILQK